MSCRASVVCSFVPKIGAEGWELAEHSGALCEEAEFHGPLRWPEAKSASSQRIGADGTHARPKPSTERPNVIGTKLRTTLATDFGALRRPPLDRPPRELHDTDPPELRKSEPWALVNTKKASNATWQPDHVIVTRRLRNAPCATQACDATPRARPRSVKSGLGSANFGRKPAKFGWFLCKFGPTSPKSDRMRSTFGRIRQHLFLGRFR